MSWQGTEGAGLPTALPAGETGQWAETGHSGNQGSENFVRSPCGIYNSPFYRELSSNNTDLLICGHFVLNTLHKASFTKAIPIPHTHPRKV